METDQTKNILRSGSFMNSKALIKYTNSEPAQIYHLRSQQNRTLFIKSILSTPTIHWLDYLEIEIDIKVQVASTFDGESFEKEQFINKTMKSFLQIVAMDFVQFDNIILFNQALHKLKYQTESHIDHFLEPFKYNKLLLKYIFTSNKCKIKTRLFLQCILNQFKLEFYRETQESKVVKNLLLSCDGSFFSILLFTIKYWKCKHFIFAFEHGLIKIISWILQYFFVEYLFPKETKKKQHNQARKECVYAGFFKPAQIMNEVLDRMNTVDCKNKCLYKVYINTLEQELNDDNFVCLSSSCEDCGQCNKFESQFKNDEGRQDVVKKMILTMAKDWNDVESLKGIPKLKNIQIKRESMIGNDDNYCGWILCQRSLLKYANKKICKGCRLIKYCSRNHQKKHWNYIHRQQCFRFK